MMDTDTSSDENTSSECTTDSSDDDRLETAQLSDDVQIQLPQGLCEHKDVFEELFSSHVWNAFTENQKLHLSKFLPDFPENDQDEKNVTLQMLLQGEDFQFGSPLLNFHEHLKAGYFRPDIAKMRLKIKKAQRREAKQRYRSYRERLKQELLESRNKLLGLVRSLPPGVEPKSEKKTLNFSDSLVHRTKRRYFQELATIRAKVEETGYSSDENYPEGPPVPLSRKQKRHLNSIKNTYMLSGDKVYISSMATKPTGLDFDRYISPHYNPFFVNEDTYKNLLGEHKRRKIENPSDPELDTKGISTCDIVYRTQLPYVKRLPSVAPLKHHIKLSNKKRLKREPSAIDSNDSKPFAGQSSNSEVDSDSDAYSVLSSNSIKQRMKSKLIKSGGSVTTPVKVKTEIKQESVEAFSPPKPAPVESVNSVPKPPPYSQYGKVTPATFSDLDGIDMMNLPIDLEDSNIDILELNTKPELMQETHSNFLSLIRDIICSTSEHRMTIKTLEERLKSWQENPISPLNDWYSLSENWVGLLQSAINFLSGNFPEQPEEFVPYIEYKPQLDAYQWIGAGRDSDNLLSPLAQYWLEHKNEIKTTLAGREREEVDVEVVDRSQTPPPPRCPTTWTVRKADLEEIKSFREQERRRYDNPHKAFTYRCNGYESVVGPLKGIYNASVGNTKARGHTMLNADRPNFVTILSLVRDATARLPNGEGTRADICELLKSSQYISSNAPDNVLQSVVSGALDRMHTQFDPCVKYDPKRKIWIYLHRNRTEEDFERIHQQYQGMNKSAKKHVTKPKTPSKPKAKVEKASKTTNKEATEKQKTVQPTTEVVTAPTVSPKPSTSTVEPAPEATQKQEPVTIKRVPTKLQQKMVQEEKEINEALQAIVQNQATTAITKQVTSPKPGKSLVKIISPNAGKSLIIQSSGNHILKHTVHESRGTKQINQPQILTQQQLIQQLSGQQKQTVQIIQKPAKTEMSEKSEQKVVMQPQVIQSINPQQLKNVTLLRNTPHTQNSLTPVTISLPQPNNTIELVDVEEIGSTGEEGGREEVPIGKQVKLQTSTTLTAAHQQQILQTLKSKGLPVQSTLLSPQQHQIILKQKAAVAQLQLQKQAQQGTSLLGQARTIAEPGNMKPVAITTQAPVVAKVLTNAAGQVISVGSLLAHQKQHGSLPQGTTLRVSGAKPGQPNIIQLASPVQKQSSVAHFTVTSQNNLITLTNQPKLVVATSQTTSVTSTVTITKPITKTITKTHTVGKLPQKVTQQLINAKIITQTVDSQKIVQPKILVGQQNQLKSAVTRTVSATKPSALNPNANTIRMVNAANLNITHIGGKPVLLAGKGSTIQTIQGQNVILQTQPSSSNPGIVIQNPSKGDSNPGTNVNLLGQNAQVVIGPQLKVQQSPQVVLSSSGKCSTQQNPSPGAIVLGTNQMRLQTSSPSNTQRVVLASSSQGGQIVAQQILLPAGFQGAAFNIKGLQGVKVIPIAQAQHVKGVQGRQVFARLVSPTNVPRTPQPASTPTEVVTAETAPTTE